MSREQGETLLPKCSDEMARQQNSGGRIKELNKLDIVQTSSEHRVQ